MTQQDRDWWRATRTQLKRQSVEFSQKQRQAYRLATLKRAGRRIADLAPHCATCHEYEHEITRLVEELPHLPDSKAQRLHQLETLQAITRHLRKAHDLVTKRYLIIRGLNYGALLGMGVGLGLDLFVFRNGIALAIGMFLGLTLGFVIARRRVSQTEEDGRLL